MEADDLRSARLCAADELIHCCQVASLVAVDMLELGRGDGDVAQTCFHLAMFLNSITRSKFM